MVGTGEACSLGVLFTSILQKTFGFYIPRARFVVAQTGWIDRSPCLG